MPLLTLSALTVDGVELPPPKVRGLKITPEKVWSANAGRTGSAEMVGTIVAIKHKLEIAWPPLTAAQADVIEGVASDVEHPFRSLSYTTVTGQTGTIIVYFGSPTYTGWDWVGGEWRLMDAAVSAVEK